MSGDAAANEVLINRFYEAFARRDGEAMAACYAAGRPLSRPGLPGSARRRGRRRCGGCSTGRAEDLEVRHSKVHADAEHGSAHWDAGYTFNDRAHGSQPRSTPSFEFADGLITEHRDEFDLYAWARQAIGPVGIAARLDADRSRDRIRSAGQEGTRRVHGRGRADAAHVNERLSASDMSSLLAERGPIHVHVGATIVVAGKPPGLRPASSSTSSRASSLIPRFRQKITSVGTMALNNPVWADDARFDIERHVRRVALPKPGRDGRAARAGRAG